MPQPDPPRRDTHVLVEASEIFQALYPTALASLLLVIEDERYTQAEIADRIGCADSTVSKARQTLKDLPVPLVEKGRQRYKVTDEGKKVIGLVDQMTDRLDDHFDIDLDSIDWHDDTQKAAVETLLAPLSNSQSTVPIFIMDALGARSGNSESLGMPPPVPVEQIIRDVKMRRKERGASVSSEQVRQSLRRFEDAGTIRLDGPECRLREKKGQEQAWLLDQFVQLLNEDRDAESEERTSMSVSHPEIQQPSTPEYTGTTPTPRDTGESVSNASQLLSRGFLGGQSTDHNSDSSMTPSIVPAYCLLSSNDVSGDESPTSSSQFQAVLPMTQLTIQELMEHVEHLASKYGNETQLASYWTLQTESGLYPLGPAELALDDVSHQAWTVINDLWHRDTREYSSSNVERGGSGNE